MKRKRPAVKFQVGQIWGRRCGPAYHLIDRLPGGWSVQVGNTKGLWNLTDRHLHNTICTERLKLMQTAGQSIVSRLLDADMGTLACKVVALLLDESEDAQDKRIYIEKQMDSANPKRKNELQKTLEKVEDILSEEGSRVRQVDVSAPANQVGRETVRQPNRITR